jgi:hypothetical protein
MEPIREQFQLLQGGRKYALSLGLVMIASAFDLSICHAWAMHRLAALANTAGAPDALRSFPVVVAPWVPQSLQFAPTEVIAALIGAYVWSLYEIISRRAMRDLTADELYPIAFRLVTAVPIGLAFANLVPNGGIKPAIAFASTAFPFRDVNQLIRQAVVRDAQRDTLGTDARRARGYLGATLQGFGHDTIVRLEELGIVTVLDMAYADPVCLMFKTGAPLREVITWLDESLLAVYAGPLTAKFAALGVPCSIDMSDIWQRHQRASTDQDKRVVADLAASLELKQPVLEDLLRRVERDPQVQFIVSVWEAGESLDDSATPATASVLNPAQA